MFTGNVAGEHFRQKGQVIALESAALERTPSRNRRNGDRIFTTRAGPARACGVADVVHTILQLTEQVLYFVHGPQSHRYDLGGTQDCRGYNDQSCARHNGQYEPIQTSTVHRYTFPSNPSTVRCATRSTRARVRACCRRDGSIYSFGPTVLSTTSLVIGSHAHHLPPASLLPPFYFDVLDPLPPHFHVYTHTALGPSQNMVT